MVENRLAVLVEPDNFLLFRGYERNVFLRFLIDGLVVDIDIAERVIEKIPQDSGGLAVFRKQLLDGLGPGYLGPRAFPFFDKGHEFGIKYCGILAFCSRPDYGPVIFGKYAPDQSLQSALLFLRSDFLGYAHFLRERKKYYVASCQ